MKKAISQNTLKWIAIVCMFLDHVGIAFFPQAVFLRLIGRMAFPIFAFLIAVSFTKTRSKTKFFFKLLFFGALSAYPHFLLTGAWQFNILLSYALFAATAIVVKNVVETPVANKAENVSNIFFASIIALASLFVAEFFFFEYGWLCIASCFSFLIYEKKPMLSTVLFAFLNTAYSIMLISSKDAFGIIQIFAVFAIVPILLSSSTHKASKFKNFFWIFYPLHMLVLGIVALIV